MSSDIKTRLIQELPDLLEKAPSIRESVWRLITPYFAPREQTESRLAVSLTLQTYLVLDRGWPRLQATACMRSNITPFSHRKKSGTGLAEGNVRV